MACLNWGLKKIGIVKLLLNSSNFENSKRLDKCSLKKMGILPIPQVTSLCRKSGVWVSTSKTKSATVLNEKKKRKESKRILRIDEYDREIDRPARWQLQGKRNDASLKLRVAVAWCGNRERIEVSNALVGKWMKSTIRNVDVKSEMFEIQTMLGYINCPRRVSWLPSGVMEVVCTVVLHDSS